MSGSPQEILLVTPVWNDSSRLEVFGAELARALSSCPLTIRWVIADDGSAGDEPDRLAALCGSFAATYRHVEVHLAAEHLGKGAVVRAAWALGATADFLAFVDADGSVSADDMLGLLAKAVRLETSVVAVRRRTATTRVVESPLRGVAHRGFLWTAKVLLGIRSDDIQCGAKVLKGSDYRQVEPLLREEGLAFDSELLAALTRAGFPWNETPVNWVEKKGGKVKPLRDAWKMLAALFRIRRRMR
jgi:dolichyl-phosphate beta-glucosyltransferase